MPSVIPPSPTLDDQFFWDAVADGRLRLPALRRVRRRAPPTGADVRRVPLGGVGHPGVERARARLHVDRVAPPHQARRRTARRGARRARRGHPLRANLLGVDAERRAATAWRSTVEHRGRRRRGAPPVPAGERARRVMALSPRHRHRRHRPDRVLQALGPQRAPARGRGGRGRGRRRRAHPRRHRRRGHLRHGRQRRARGHALRRHPGAALHRPHARRRRRRRAPPCSSRPPRSRRARPTRSSSTARSTSARGGASASRSPRTTSRASMPPGWNWYLPFGLDTPAKVYALWYQRYMHRTASPTRTSACYPVVARKHAATNPDAWFYYQRRSRSRTTRSRGGSSSRSCACSTAARRATAASRSSSPAWSGRATCRSDPVRVAAATPGVTCATATRCSTTTAATSPASRRRRSSGGSSTRPPGSRPTTSTWR